MREILKFIGFLAVIFLFGFAFYNVDSNRAENNTDPLFCLPLSKNVEKQTTTYYGAGYKIVKYSKTNNDSILGLDTKYEVGSWFTNFDDSTEANDGNVTNVILGDVNYEYKNIQSHSYIEGSPSEKADIIRSTADLKKYLEVFDDNTLKRELNNYKDEYFKDKVLVIVTIVESSGANTNSIYRVAKKENGTSLYVFIDREKPEFGTADMAMWHLLVEVNKTDFQNIKKVVIK